MRSRQPNALRRPTACHSCPAAEDHGHFGPADFDEVYKGRRVEGRSGGHHGHAVLIDGVELHVMRNADGTWISVVGHYAPVASPRAAALPRQLTRSKGVFMTVRKNQATLTADEKRRFVAAVLELKRTGRYDAFVTTHNAFIMSDTDNGERTGHRSPSFLPWHRRFLLDFERALQTVDASVALPYWDWSADRSVRASLWAPDFLGGTGRSRDGRVMDGPFAADRGDWPISVRVDGRTYLRRALGTAVRELPTRGEVDSVLAMATYDRAPWNSASDGFRNHLEGWRGVNLHNRVHVWVGGQMATGVSPNDPVFWLHHAYVDKLWAAWQRRHPGATYVPAAGTPDVVDLDEPMKPWNDTRPADLLDHTRHYTFDTD